MDRRHSSLCLLIAMIIGLFAPGCTSTRGHATSSDIEVLRVVGATMDRGVAQRTIAPRAQLLEPYGREAGVRELLARNGHASLLPSPLTPQASGLLVHVSLPGYSADGTSAVVYAEERCPDHCGWGALVRLTKTRDGWRVSSVEQLFVA